MIALASFACGIVFGLGLLVSGMTQPPKVLGFLDVLGRWDPTMGFVMAGAVLVSGAGFALARRQQRPWLTPRHLWPTRRDVDGRLVVGAVLFGAGWGLVGLCPGPALENLASLSPQVFVFVLAMGAGMALQDLWQHRAPRAKAIENAALATGADG
jgi:uncharacterized membrane protein YedE/YeeE